MGVFDFLNRTKKPKIFKDDDQFKDIYNIIAKCNDIDFDTDDNKSFKATIDNKVWVHLFYITGFSDDKVTPHGSVRIIIEADCEGKPVRSVSVQTNFSEENNEALSKLLGVKVDQWRVNNLDRVEAERKEKMKKALQ